MSIRRTKLPHEGRHTYVPNRWARDKRLTRKARGLLVELLSHKPGWYCTIESLQKRGKEGRDALRTAIAELEEFGYLTRDHGRRQDGAFEVDYHLSAPTIEPPDDDDDDATEPVDNYRVGLSDPAEINRDGNGLSDVGLSALRENYLKEEINQSHKSTHVGGPVDNSDDEITSLPRLTLHGWAARAKARRALDVDKLFTDVRHVFADFPGEHQRPIVLLVAYRILGKAAQSGSNLIDPNAYVARAIENEPEVWRKFAFGLDVRP